MQLNQNRTWQWSHNERDVVSNHQPCDCLLNCLFRRRSKKTSKLRVIGICATNSPEAGGFPAQMASNAENVSIWWRHHDVYVDKRLYPILLLPSNLWYIYIYIYIYIRRTLVGSNIVDHSDVVGALPVGTAPTTSSFSTEHLASMAWAKITARNNSFSGFGAPYIRYLTVDTITHHCPTLYPTETNWSLHVYRLIQNKLCL